ncbi:MAG: phosphate/phosphonate ABC transporter permease [Bacilli bacterium]|nr:phosphate/phosphonate ABC transporter permease [Bacilli bacterium]
MREYTLSSGTKVKQPFNKIWFILAIVLVLTIIFATFIPIPDKIFLSELGTIMRRLFVPYGNRTWKDYFGYFNYQDMGIPLIQSIQISLGGTIIGSLLAFPIAFLSAGNIVKNKFLQIPTKVIMNFIRSIPIVILAVMAVFVVGTGILSGIVAVTLFSFGIMSKMLYEAIETVDMSAFEALESSGANKFIAFYYAVFTEIKPIYLGYMIYIFEINVRSSAVLGYVGAGGIGQVISDNVLYNYNKVGVAIIVMFLTVIAVQIFSNWARRKLK